MGKIGKIIGTYKNTNLVVRAGIWFLLVTIIDKGISILTQPFINRILSLEEVGVFGVYTSWRSIFSVVATFNLFGGVLEVYLTKEPEQKNRIVLSLCSLSILISIVFWSTVFVFGNQISNLLGLKKIYLLFMALAITAEAIISFWSVPKRFEYSYKPYAILIVSLFFTKSVLSVALTYLMPNDRVLGRILGLALPAIFVSIVILIKIVITGDRGNIINYWKKGFLFNLPLIPHYLSSILLASSDKIMIQHLAGKADAGLYTVAYSYSSLALIVFSAVNSTYNPISMKAIKNKNYELLQKSTELLVILSVVFSVFMMLLAPEGLWLLGGEKYMSTLNIIPVLVIGIFFSSFYFVFSNVEFVYEKNKLIFPITFVGALINIILNYFMISRIGYKAAAYTTFIGQFFIAISHYYVSRRIIGKDIYNIKRICLILAFMFFGGALSLGLYMFSNIIRYTVIILMFMFMAILVYKKRTMVLSMISKKIQL